MKDGLKWGENEAGRPPPSASQRGHELCHQCGGHVREQKGAYLRDVAEGKWTGLGWLSEWM